MLTDLADKLDKLADDVMGDLSAIRERYRENNDLMNAKTRLFTLAGQCNAAADQLRKDAGGGGWDRRAADFMAAVVDDMIHRYTIDARSMLGDARLDYGDPFTDEERERILARERKADPCRTIFPDCHGLCGPEPDPANPIVMVNHVRGCPHSDMALYDEVTERLEKYGCPDSFIESERAWWLERIQRGK